MGKAVEVASQFLHQANADSEIVSNFRALADSGRYSEKAVLERLARIVVGAGGGPNRDAPLYELCHLVNAIDACGFGTAERMLFFMGEERVVPDNIQRQFAGKLGENGWLRSGFEIDGKGVNITYPDGDFAVRFGRMPLLTALYEFLSSMDDFTFFGELNDIFVEMLAGPVTIKSIKQATGQLASKFRKYRHAHMDWARHEEKFDRIAPFLSERAIDGQWRVDDQAVLDFWLLHSQGKEFKGYKTVFDAFVTLLKTMERATLGKSAEGARTMGLDRDAGEVEIGNDMQMSFDDFSDWSSPFEVFDEEGLRGIKFFKAASERKPIEGLMRYGPDVCRLPLAFLRVESFAPVQSGITTDLQVKRGAESIRKRITCEDVMTYVDKTGQYQASMEHITNLQKAVLHIVTSRNAADIETGADSELKDDAKSAFEGLKRKGFGADAMDGERLELFRTAGEALVAMSNQLHHFLDKVSRLSTESHELDQQFLSDRGVFSRQFEKLYGGVL